MGGGGIMASSRNKEELWGVGDSSCSETSSGSSVTSGGGSQDSWVQHDIGNGIGRPSHGGACDGWLQCLLLCPLYLGVCGGEEGNGNRSMW